MQDSLEDYLRISKNKKLEDDKPIRQIQLTAARKLQCNARALKIVEFSIDGKLLPEVFLKCLSYIDQSHYQDIVEERAITKLCGYPVCGRRLPMMPEKQYHISVTQNKVYDITDRKNYCSNFCYKASIHIKKQIDTSPLWLRKFDSIPKYKLLPSTEVGLPGQEVDQGIAKPIVNPVFTPISSFTEVSLGDMVDSELGRKRDIHIKRDQKKVSAKSSMQTIIENDKSFEKEKPDEDQTKETSISVSDNMNKKPCKKEKTFEDAMTEKYDTKHLEETPSLQNISSDNQNEKKDNRETKCEEKIVKSKSKKICKTKLPRSLNTVPNEVENNIRKCLREWFTLETHLYLFGEEEVKEKLANDKLSEFFEALKIDEDQQVQKMKYLEVCRKLHLKELADEKFDKQLIGRTTLEPIPDFQKLKEESKVLDLKVKSFYGGSLYETEHSNFPKKEKDQQDETSRENADDNEGQPAILPLIDNKSQNALRRKIFLTSAKKAMQTLLQKLKFPPLAIVSDLQALVKTFELKADNIVLKPFVWNYISVTLLKILALRDPEIGAALEADRCAQEYIDLILMELPSNKEFVSYAIDLVKNSDVLINKYLAMSDALY